MIVYLTVSLYFAARCAVLLPGACAPRSPSQTKHHRNVSVCGRAQDAQCAKSLTVSFVPYTYQDILIVSLNPRFVQNMVCTILDLMSWTQ